MHKRAAILLIEDYPAIRDALKYFLEMEGYQVAIAENGQQAMNTLTENRLPALIILDLNMPVMDGREFLCLRESLPWLKEVPVIVQTAERDPYPTQNIQGFITKSEISEQLLPLIEKILAAS